MCIRDRAKDSSLDNLLTKLMQLFVKNIRESFRTSFPTVPQESIKVITFLATEDENIKSAVGQTLLAVASQNQEAVQERSEKIVPVIFFAMHLKKTGTYWSPVFLPLSVNFSIFW